MIATAVRQALWAAEGAEGAAEGAAAGVEGAVARHTPLLVHVIAEELGVAAADVVDFDLQLCDTQEAVLGGALSEFIYSGRLDNLCSCYMAAEALIETDASVAHDTAVRVIALFDHEEVFALDKAL